MVVERIIPDTKDWNLNFKTNLIRYNFALPYIKNKNVLDVACGSGYFSNYILSKGAKSVTGVDIDKDSIEYAKNNFQNISLEFLEWDAENLGSLNKSFDIVVSMETIEHLNYPMKFLSEIKKVLIPNGYLILSTPNKEVSTVKNVFHKNEFTYQELRKTLDSFFLIENSFSLKLITKRKQEKFSLSSRLVSKLFPPVVKKLFPYKLKHSIVKTLNKEPLDLSLEDFEVFTEQNKIKEGEELIAIVKKK